MSRLRVAPRLRSEFLAGLWIGLVVYIAVVRVIVALGLADATAGSATWWWRDGVGLSVVAILALWWGARHRRALRAAVVAVVASGVVVVMQEVDMHVLGLYEFTVPHTIVWDVVVHSPPLIVMAALWTRYVNAVKADLRR